MRARKQPSATIDHGFSHSVACIMAAESYWKGVRVYWDAERELIEIVPRGGRNLSAPHVHPSRRVFWGRIPYRWWIGGLLFASTTINYIDRQTLSALAPYLKREFAWNNSDFALIVIAFRAAYTIFQAVSGRLLDKLGTRQGLSLAVLWYSIAAFSTSLATGLKKLRRSSLPVGAASGDSPGRRSGFGWFAKRERGIAVAFSTAAPQ